ncbi:aspartic peptidase domain-containing protein [Lasiosphaeris hirsuta]|uniref:Aspartic peptidase domain-containing protein n=1 Tax=Lasiosphaeris hirsuta TaxID=260670 RepID=A0AA39ZST3_9PEZI|nr:aspartic peptidase domain-containing protein [Lasiosphaeris hirsuta]
MPKYFLSSLGLLVLSLAPSHAIHTPQDAVSVVPTDDFLILAAKTTSGRLNPRQTTKVFEDPNQISYSVEMDIGGKPFTLLVDTGSGTTWVTPPDGQYTCTQLSDNSECTVGTRHLAVTSAELSPSNPLGSFSISYQGGGEATGYYVDRSLQLAPGLTVAHQAIGVATSFKQDAHSGSPSWMDGLLGLGPWIDYSSPFFSILSSLKIKQFGLALFGDADTDSKASNGGLLSFSGYPSALKITSSWATIPLLWELPYSYWYTIEPDSYVINGNKVGNQGVPLIVDSGTTYTRVPRAVAAELYKLLPGTGSSDPLKACGSSPGPNEKCLADGLWKIPCDAKMPAFGIVLGGMEFQFQADNLNAVNGNLCFCSVGPISSADETGVLGFSFWKNDVMVVHDWTDAEKPKLMMATYEDPEK